jgi:hypothetical protein
MKKGDAGRSPAQKSKVVADLPGLAGATRLLIYTPLHPVRFVANAPQRGGQASADD